LRIGRASARTSGPASPVNRSAGGLPWPVRAAKSTVRKLVRRLGAEVIDESCRVDIIRATTGERRFVARAARIDSTVIEADVRYPTDIGLAADATKALVRTGPRRRRGQRSR
jgi:hypothetical protein